METILATAFGYKVELLRGKVDGGNELVQAARDIFNIPIGGGMIGVTLLSLNCKELANSVHFQLLFSMFPAAHFQWLTPLMRLIATCIPLRSKFVNIRKTALAFVQARRSNPIAKVYTWSNIVELTLFGNFSVEEGFASTVNRC